MVTLTTPNAPESLAPSPWTALPFNCHLRACMSSTSKVKPCVPVTTYWATFLPPDVLRFIFRAGEETARVSHRSLRALSLQYDLLGQYIPSSG